MARRRKTTPVTTEVGHLRRATRWAGLRAGDEVEIGGANLRGATWSFVAHVTNTETAEAWVEVIGGKPGHRTVRSFPPAQVFPRSKKQMPSLDEAPQLPL
jgi:hypothetical protein